MTRFFQGQGSNASDAASQAIAWVGQTLQHQVDLLAYIDVFWWLMIVGLVMVPVALIIKPVNLSAAAKGH
jgi:DHA2 family multidrug resistance protein